MIWEFKIHKNFLRVLINIMNINCLKNRLEEISRNFIDCLKKMNRFLLKEKKLGHRESNPDQKNDNLT